MSAADDAQAVLDKAKAAYEYEQRTVDGAERLIQGIDDKKAKAQSALDAIDDSRVVAERDLAACEGRVEEARADLEAAQAAYDEVAPAEGEPAPEPPPSEDTVVEPPPAEGTSEGQAG